MTKFDKYFTNYTLAQTNNTNSPTTTDLNNIEKTLKSNEQVVKENAKQLDVLVNNYHNTGIFTAVDIFTGISSLSVLLVAIASYIKLIQLPIKNVISYISLLDIKTKNKVENILSQMLAIANCNRVCVGIFHDGVNIGTIHFTKMSVIYEVTSANVAPIKYTVKNVDIDKLESEILLTNKDTFTSITLSTAPALCKDYMNSVGIKKTLSRRLESDSGIFGLFECQWLEEQPSIDIMNDTPRLEQLNSLFRSLYVLLKKLSKTKPVFNW